METNATFFINDEKEPIKYGKINLINTPRQRLRGEEKKSCVIAYPVFCGFCGTDYELMKMGSQNKLNDKFPKGEKRLINGHEGIVWYEKEERFAILLIRGGDSYDPTRFTDEETYFEYGCDGADGIFCDKGYFNPNMLLSLPKKYDGLKKLPLSLAKKLVFSDPYACAVFQYERMCDIGVAQNFRVEMAKRKCEEVLARQYAKKSTFERTVIFGLGTTGLFIGDQIRKNQNEAKILFVARSSSDCKKAKFVKEEMKCDYLSTNDMSESEIAKSIVKNLGANASVFIGTSGTDIEHRIAFEQSVLGCNGIYNSFSLGPKVTYDTMPFGFKNQVILSSINFTQKHMETAIEILCDSNFDSLVELIDKDEFIKNPMDAYINKIYSLKAPLKTGLIWNDKYIDMEK